LSRYGPIEFGAPRKLAKEFFRMQADKIIVVASAFDQADILSDYI